MRNGSWAKCLLATAVLACASAEPLPTLAGLGGRVSEFRLPNGIHFIVAERRYSPAVSFHLYVNAGAVDEPPGKSGVATLFESLILAGTESIGTTNAAAERIALDAVEQALSRWESAKGGQGGPYGAQQAELNFRISSDQARRFAIPDQYGTILAAHGTSAFRAGVSADESRFVWTMPSDRTELWFRVHGEWLRKPVFRLFYALRNGLRDRRLRELEDAPQGKFMASALKELFADHPYGRLSEAVDDLRVADAVAFFETYYAPSNLTIAIAGDINLAEARKFAETHMGKIPARAGPRPPGPKQALREQEQEKRITVESRSVTALLAGYRRPDRSHADDIVFDLIQAILGGGSEGALYRELVAERQLASMVSLLPNWPGDRYSSLFVVALLPARGHTVEQNEAALEEVFESMRSQPLAQPVLEEAKNRLRAGLLRRLESNAGLAAELARFHARYGSWTALGSALDRLGRVTAEDIQRVARHYFQPASRAVARSGLPAPPEVKQ